MEGKQFSISQQLRKKSDVAILVIHNVKFNLKLIKRDKKGHYILVKRKMSKREQKS